MKDESFAISAGPHLSAAFLCEKVLTERDGVYSIIRMVDRFTLPVFKNVPPGVQIPPPVVQGTLVVAVKGGGLPAGKYTIKAVGQKPDGGFLPEGNAQVFFPGGEDNGIFIAFPIGLAMPDEGLYWFDIYFEGVQLTRVPMRVLHQQAVLPPFPQQAPEQ